MPVGAERASVGAGAATQNAGSARSAVSNNYAGAATTLAGGWTVYLTLASIGAADGVAQSSSWNRANVPRALACALNRADEPKGLALAPALPSERVEVHVPGGTKIALSRAGRVWRGLGKAEGGPVNEADREPRGSAAALFSPEEPIGRFSSIYYLNMFIAGERWSLCALGAQCAPLLACAPDEAEQPA